MTTNCFKCAELRAALDSAERDRVAARGRFESHTSVAAAQEAATAYRAASDAVNRALADLALHRASHTTPDR